MTSSLFDLDLSKLNIAADDKTTRKLMMLIEGTYGIGVKASMTTASSAITSCSRPLKKKASRP